MVVESRKEVSPSRQYSTIIDYRGPRTRMTGLLSLDPFRNVV